MSERYDELLTACLEVLVAHYADRAAEVNAQLAEAGAPYRAPEIAEGAIQVRAQIPAGPHEPTSLRVVPQPSQGLPSGIAGRGQQEAAVAICALVRVEDCAVEVGADPEGALVRAAYAALDAARRAVTAQAGQGQAQVVCGRGGAVGVAATVASHDLQRVVTQTGVVTAVLAVEVVTYRVKRPV